MGRALAIMVAMTTYGTRLGGDRRGWVDHGVIMPPDPVVEARDADRMKHPPYHFDHGRPWDSITPLHEWASRLQFAPGQ